MNPTREGSFHHIYEAMERDESDKDYLENVALAALSAMDYETIHEARKNNFDSEYYREEGNSAYKNGLLQKALVNYNKAMAYAPNGSLCLKLAYSNRSAVLFSAKEYEACEKDCSTALAIKCMTPSMLSEKLEKRLSQARMKQRNIPLQRDTLIFQKYADDFFKLKSRNSDVPCVSADVDIVIESGIPKVIAKKDIAAGTLVGLEKAFVTWAPNESIHYFSCHFCCKLGLNLFPCGGCVSAMFCSKQCEERCMAEYHIIECKIAGFINKIPPNKTWILKAVLKLKNMCASWDELISMSYVYGCNRIEKGTVNDIYDGENPSSILSFHKERHFLYGSLFHSAIECAFPLLFLQNLQSFLPEDRDKKSLAMKAMARIIMYLNLYITPTLLPLVTNISATESIGFLKLSYLGLFAFIGKLKHSCMPNLQTLAVNNSTALVALENIKAGTELTISHIHHWVISDSTYKVRRKHMLLIQSTFCTCIICSASPKVCSKETELTATQRRAIQECVPLEMCRVFGIPVEKCFERIYKALTCLHKIPFSTDYEKLLNMLNQLQMYVLDNKLHNCILSKEF